MVKQSAKKYRITNSKSDKIFDAVNIVIMILLLFIFVWPLWFVVISSFKKLMGVPPSEYLAAPDEDGEAEEAQ